MKLQKIEVGTNNLKKYIFLFIKGHLNNGDLMGEANDKLEDIIDEIEHLMVTSKYEVNIEKDYPFLLKEDGEQIGNAIEEYLDEVEE